MNFKDMLDKLSVLSEATKETEKGRVHKADPGGYGRKYDTDEEGDEKDGDKDAAKPQEKRGRGRPAKTGAHVSSPAEKKKQQDKEKASKDLQSFIVGNVPKKPSKELKNLPSKKHSLKEFFEQIDEERMLKEAEQITMEPAKQSSQVIKQGTKTLGTVTNPALAATIKSALGKGEMSLAGTELGEEKGEKWIQKAIKHPGALRKKLGAKEGEPIPAGKLEKATHSKDPTTARQARLAQTLRKINKEGVNEGWEGVAEGTDTNNLTNVAHALGKLKGREAFVRISDPQLPLDNNTQFKRGIIYDREVVHGLQLSRPFKYWLKDESGKDFSAPERDVFVRKQGVAEGDIDEVEQPTMDNMTAMGAGLGAGRNPNALEEAKKTVKKDDKAEKAGKKVAKDIEYDEKVKDKIHGKKRHAEDEKAERAGKKVAKDIEYDEKKKKQVKEAAKPDFPDIDDDDNKKESIKKAAQDAKKKKMTESAHRHSSARLMGKAHALAKEAYNCKYEDMEEAKMYHEGYKEGLDECYGLMPIRGVVVGEEMPAATVPGMASQAMPAMEADIEEMDKGEWMKHKAQTTPGDTFKAFGQTMHDKDVLENEFAFESLDKQLNDLLTEGEKVEEGMSVSISKGQQGAPDSVTVSAQDSEAEKLLGFIKQVGLGLFGDEGRSDYGSPMSAEPKHSHGEIEVVDDHDGMMSLMKKMSGMDQGGEDYRDEEHHADEHGHDHEENCNECGYMESQCKCDEEMVDEVESYDQEEYEVAEEAEEMEEGGDIDELRRLAGTVKPAPAADQKRGIEEDNPPDSEEAEHTADEEAEAAEDSALAKSDQQDKTLTVNEDGDEASEEPEEGMAESEHDKDKLDEWANEAGQRGTDAAFMTDDEFMIDTISSGLNKRKVTGQTTIPVIASQNARDGSEDVSAWKKLAGITK